MAPISISELLFDPAPPTIMVQYPTENATYTAPTVDLNFTINEPAKWIGYSLDWQNNITITGNAPWQDYQTVLTT